MKRALVLFRNDLRLHDNFTLTTACQSADEVLLLYCFDPRLFKPLDLGFPKTGIHRAKFILESLQDLRKLLKSAQGELVIRKGLPEKEVLQLVEQYNIQEIHLQREVTDEETQVEEAIENNLKHLNCQLYFHWGLTLYHPDDLPFSANDTPEAFKAFRNDGTKLSQVRDEITTPEVIHCIENIDPGELPSLTELGYDEEMVNDTPYPGGETYGLARLQHFFYDTEQLTRYKWTRNQSLGMDYSSKFSPWLAHGCLSPRRVYHEVKRYEQEITKNISTYWLIFEMLWRDYFKYLGLKHGTKIFWVKGIYNKSVDWKRDKNLFEAWCQAKTGIPFVDAHMTELNHTGFMSNRGRVNVSTYLTRDLGIDWTWGAAYFESLLVDYDVTSNWLNWYFQAVAWRYTHVLWQSTNYDSNGAYIKHWLPVLDKLPDKIIPIVFLLTEKEQNDHMFFLGKDYHNPILIPDKWQRQISRLKRSK